MLAALASVLSTLARGTSPSDAYLPAGADGIYVSVFVWCIGSCTAAHVVLFQGMCFIQLNIFTMDYSLSQMHYTPPTPQLKHILTHHARAQVAVSNHPGQALNKASLILGPAATEPNATADYLSAGGDVRIAFEGPLVAPCAFVNDSGVEVQQPCGAGMVTATASYFQVCG